MTRSQLGKLILPREHGGTPGNLHEQAWDESDRVISERRRGGR